MTLTRLRNSGNSRGQTEGILLIQGVCVVIKLVKRFSIRLYRIYMYFTFSIAFENSQFSKPYHAFWVRFKSPNGHNNRMLHLVLAKIFWQKQQRCYIVVYIASQVQHNISLLCTLFVCIKGLFLIHLSHNVLKIRCNKTKMTLASIFKTFTLSLCHS